MAGQAIPELLCWEDVAEAVDENSQSLIGLQTSQDHIADMLSQPTSLTPYKMVGPTTIIVSIPIFITEDRE